MARVIVLLSRSGTRALFGGHGRLLQGAQKLPEEFLRRLTYQVGVEDQAPAKWRWHNRRTLLVDGAETIADDTAANQAAYPQPTSQRPGLGFPIIRFVVLLTFATASVVGAAFGPIRRQGNRRDGAVSRITRAICVPATLWWPTATTARTS